jgi:hypothetical protein
MGTMTLHTDEHDQAYYLSVDEAREDGYAPVKCNSALQYFELDGRKTVMVKENIVPITDLKYMVLAKYPGGDRYFTRTYHNYTLDELFWYRRSPTFSGQDDAIENLRKYVSDSRITLLLEKQQVANTSEMLRRVYKAQFKKDGQLDYRVYLKLLDLSLKREDYVDVAKELTGFRTALKQFDDAINELWKSVMK